MDCKDPTHPHAIYTTEYIMTAEVLQSIRSEICQICDIHRGPLWEVDLKQAFLERVRAEPGPNPLYVFTIIHEPCEEFAQLFGILSLEVDDEDGDEIYITKDDVEVSPVMCELCGNIQATRRCKDEDWDEEDENLQGTIELCEACFNEDEGYWEEIDREPTAAENIRFKEGMDDLMDRLSRGIKDEGMEG